MAKVCLSIGSNIEREKNICSCLKILSSDYPDIIYSQTYETASVGFEGDAFLNLAAFLETKQSIEQMESYLKQLEDKHSRKRDGVKFSSRTLDVDLLLYDDLILQPEKDIPRKEITQYAFVLFPLAEIASELIHPELNTSIKEIAATSSLDKTQLKAVKLPCE